MSFPRYPSYKDSGVEWLGKVPWHWDVLALKSRFQIIGGSTPKSETESFWNGDILWATPSDLSKRDSVYINDTQRKITATGLASCGTRLVPAGSIVLSTRAPIGSLAIAETAMCTNQGCKSLIPTKNANTDFFAYLLSISSTELNIRGKGTTFLELSGDELGAFKTPVPPHPEQTQIAAFLDRETAKIDELVTEQRRLMALLKEKRQAVISHAVTQGLNPHAPMKPSGIEWLGDVPKHWSSPKLKTLAIDQPAAFTNGPFGSDLLTSELHVEGVPVIYIRDLKIDGYRRRSTSYVTADKAIQLDKFRVDENDILIAKVGDPPGFCCTYPKGEPPGIICQDVIRMKPNLELVLPDYLCFLLNSPPGVEAVDSICIQLTRKRFSLADLHSLRLPLPPRPEQGEILNWLKRIVGEFCNLTTEAQRAIDLLQERRTALISAAVTGQIDVRGAVDSP
ncbi:MAG: restriction endonuclease subunit S [Pseudomonadota bacterium]